MHLARSLLFFGALILGATLLWSRPSTQTVPSQVVIPDLPSSVIAVVPPRTDRRIASASSSTQSTSVPSPPRQIPPPSDPHDLLFHVNRARSIPAEFPLGIPSYWTPCLGNPPKNLIHHVRDFICLPRKYMLRASEALRKQAWDSPAPPMTQTHDGLPVGGDGRVGVRPLLDAALRAGYELRIRSGFRPYLSQVVIFRSWVRQQQILGFSEVEAEHRASASSAHAGHSEHQLGTTVDIVYREPSGRFYEGWDAQKMAASEPMQWVETHAHRFGLVISYDRETTKVTQYVWEPWHLRFVGVEAADEIHRRKISLEAFLQERYGVAPPPPFALPASPLTL